MSIGELRDRLFQQSKEVLVDLLVQHGELDERLRERLLLLASTASAHAGESMSIDIDDLERAIRRAVEVQGYIDYRGASLYAMQVEQALD